MSTQDLPRQHALAMPGLVVLAWGVNWPITKMIVREVSPLWATAFRCAIAAAALGALLSARGLLLARCRPDRLPPPTQERSPQNHS